MNKEFIKMQQAAAEKKLVTKIKDNMHKHKTTKEIFEEDKECFTSCPRYNPCPICSKCENKASHLYIKCELCQIPMCTHKYMDRQHMIKRENNTIQVSRETIDKLKAIAAKREQVINNENSAR
ncbi:hypothetical protein [Clostridium sp. YIM B02555]|uniref:hypothetical protein n=1 Tax=Clostridium sp. YIM B02555 TaxID=2911968 RepID=UPI001EEE55E7|nr:hypothetical protein [Clostridium sp. YIM B02555]